MYNTNLTITYHTIDGDDGDTQYRRQLLGFLNLQIYNDDVSNHIDTLYDDYNDTCHLKKVFPWMKNVLEQRWPFEMDNKTIFLFLFSFDYFYLIYPIICNLINKTTVSEDDFDNLRSKIKSNLIKKETKK
jgi:hypothetical protein